MWHRNAHVLLAGTQDGGVWMWKVPSGECKMMQGHGCSATVGKLLPDGKLGREKDLFIEHITYRNIKFAAAT